MYVGSIGSCRAWNRNWRYERLADKMNVVFLFIGPSRVAPMSVPLSVRLVFIRSLFPSLNRKSKTELSAFPLVAGNAPE